MLGNSRRVIHRVALALFLLVAPSLITASDDLCKTQDNYVANYLARHKELPATEICQNGPCDFAVNRDPYIPSPTDEILTVRLIFHVFANDNGDSAAATLQQVEDVMETLNADFEPHRIQFWDSVHFVNSTRYRHLVPGIDSMKLVFSADPASLLNIYVTQYEGAFGILPWEVIWNVDHFEPRWNSYDGGIVISEVQFSPDQHFLTHEIGHCLGLWHTFHGASDEIKPIPMCTGCSEWATPEGNSSDLTGDLCADTRPTPKRLEPNACSELSVLKRDTCSGWSWAPTPWENYMSYGWSCMNNFTPQQAGRMRCWTDNVLFTWLETSPIPLSPADGSSLQESLTVAFDWTDVAGAQSYDFIISTDPTFATYAFSATGLTTSAWPGTVQRICRGTYYWKARAILSGGAGPWSAVFTHTVTGCCIGRTGNVNNSANQTPDLSDLSYLTNYLNDPSAVLPCFDEANVNGQGAVDLSDLSLLVSYLLGNPRPTLPNCPCQ